MNDRKYCNQKMYDLAVLNANKQLSCNQSCRCPPHKDEGCCLTYVKNNMDITLFSNASCNRVDITMHKDNNANKKGS